MAVTETKVQEEITKSLSLQEISHPQTQPQTLSADAEPGLVLIYENIKSIDSDLASQLCQYKYIADIPQELMEKCNVGLSIIVIKDKLSSEVHKKYLTSDRIKKKLYAGELTIEKALADISDQEFEKANEKLPGYRLDLNKVYSYRLARSVYILELGVTPQMIIDYHSFDQNRIWLNEIDLIAADIPPQLILKMFSDQKQGCGIYNLSLEQMNSTKDPFCHFHLEALKKGYTFEQIQNLTFPQLDILKTGLPLELVRTMKFTQSDYTIQGNVLSQDQRNYYYNIYTQNNSPHMIRDILDNAEVISKNARQKKLNEIIELYKKLGNLKYKHLEGLKKNIAIEILLDPRFKYDHADLLQQGYPWDKIADLHRSQLNIVDTLRRKGPQLEEVMNNKKWTILHSMAIDSDCVSYDEIKDMDAKELEEYIKTPCYVIMQKQKLARAMKAVDNDYCLGGLNVAGIEIIDDKAAALSKAISKPQ